MQKNKSEMKRSCMATIPRRRNINKEDDRYKKQIIEYVYICIMPPEKFQTNKEQHMQ